MSALALLPDDLLLRIFEHVNMTDLYTLPRVSRRFNCLLSRPSELWTCLWVDQRLAAKLDGEDKAATLDSISSWLTKRASSVKQLRGDDTVLSHPKCSPSSDLISKSMS